MRAVSALMYGVMQGLTEFLPVSSSAHLALLHAWSGGGGEEELAFDVLLHLATLAAVLLVYGRELIPLVPAFFRLLRKRGKTDGERDEKERLVLLLLLGTLPLALLLPLKGLIGRVGAQPRAVGALLLCNAAQLFLCDRAGGGRMTLETLPPQSALAVGFSQALSGFPGLSRSGTTVTWGTVLGLARAEAVKLSFLLSVPAVLGANLVELPALFAPGGIGMPASSVLLGMAGALVSGLLSVGCLRWLTEKGKMKWLGVWCAGLGLIAMIKG